MQPFILGAVVLLAITAMFTSKTMGRFISGVRIRHLASRHLDKALYRQFRNLTIAGQDGPMRLDHVVVSKYGIFVIETLHMHGWIFGKEYEPTWRHIFGSHNNAFPNPLRRGYQRIKALDNLLEVGEHKIIPVAAFVGYCKFKSETPENVVRNRGVVDYILSKTRVVFTDSELARITQTMRSGMTEKPGTEGSPEAKHPA
jgi:hypothetical protein